MEGGKRRMTELEKRRAQLDALMDSRNGITPASYRLEILNSSFLPQKAVDFSSLEEAKKARRNAAKIYKPAFVRLTAVFTIV
jgi:hypothetical protein